MRTLTKARLMHDEPFEDVSGYITEIIGSDIIYFGTNTPQSLLQDLCAQNDLDS